MSHKKHRNKRVVTQSNNSPPQNSEQMQRPQDNAQNQKILYDSGLGASTSNQMEQNLLSERSEIVPTVESRILAQRRQDQIAYDMAIRDRYQEADIEGDSFPAYPSPGPRIQL